MLSAHGAAPSSDHPDVPLSSDHPHGPLYHLGQERYFELVTLGEAAEYGAFLVYYESELKASVKGYISLEGATASACDDHPTEPYAFHLTTPARRLSLLTPGVSPGPIKVMPNGEKALECPPSLEEKMTLIEKLDTWGRHALRNVLASGPLDAPFTTWTLAAHSSAELQSWLASFQQVLSEIGSPQQAPTPGLGINGYVAIGEPTSARRASRSPLALSEEVM